MQIIAVIAQVISSKLYVFCPALPQPEFAEYRNFFFVLVARWLDEVSIYYSCQVYVF